MQETTTIFPDSAAPLMMAVIWPITAVSWLFLVMRSYSKLRSQGRFWWDDYALILSWVALLSQAVFTQVAINAGFGNHLVEVLLSGQSLFNVAVNVEIAFTLAFPAIVFSKISFALTMLRLTSGIYRAFLWFFIVTLLLLMVPTATLPWVICVPFEKIFDPRTPGSCMDANIAIRFGTFDAIYVAATDFALAMLPWKIIWTLQMKRMEKIAIGVAMSLGVFSGIAAVVKAVYVLQLHNGLDFTYDAHYVAIWTAVESGTAIVAGSIPVMRVLVKRKNGGSDNTHSSYARSRSHGTGKYPGNSLTSTVEMTTLVNSPSHNNSLRRGSAVDSANRTMWVDTASERSFAAADEPPQSV